MKMASSSMWVNAITLYTNFINQSSLSFEKNHDLKSWFNIKIFQLSQHVFMEYPPTYIADTLSSLVEITFGGEQDLSWALLKRA